MNGILLPSIFSIAALGALFGGGLAFASKKFYVKVDPRVEEITEILPGANCGACGKPGGCTGFATALVVGEVDPAGCIPGGADVADKLASIMGVTVEAKEPMVAVVRCAGGHEEAKDKFRYFGIKTCKAAAQVSGGQKACQYGCLGFGDCVTACNFDAIHIGEKGLPVVDDEKCTGCGLCVKACPKNIMDLIPITAQIYLACSSQDRGKAVKEVCSVGCNGCGLCAKPKITPSGAIKMDGFLPVVDYSVEDNLIVAKYKCPTNSFIDKVKYRTRFNIDSKCDSCGECVKVCPVKKCITGEEGERYRIDQELCIGCGWCVPVCDPKAINMIGALAYQEKI